MPSSTSDRFSRLGLYAVVAAAVGFSGLGIWLVNGARTKEKPPVERDVREHGRVIEQTLGGLIQAVTDRVTDPWFENTVVQTDMMKFIGEIDARRNLVHLTLENPTFDKEKRAAAEFFKNSEPLIKNWTARFEAFQRDLDLTLPIARDAFTILKVGSEAMAVLAEAGIAFPEEEARCREYTRLHEDGRRYWLAHLSNLIAGRSDADETVAAIGIANIRKAAEDSKPVIRSLDAARIEWLRFQNHFGGLAGRLDWAEDIAKKLPDGDPLKKAPEGDIGLWRQRHEKTVEKALAVAKRCLDRSREHERDVAAVEAELATLLADLNKPFLEAAKRNGLPLPTK